MKIELSGLDNDFSDVTSSLHITDACNHYRSKRKLIKLLFRLNSLKIKQRRMKASRKMKILAKMMNIEHFNV